MLGHSAHHSEGHIRLAPAVGPCLTSARAELLGVLLALAQGAPIHLAVDNRAVLQAIHSACRAR
eukprot:8020853-Alexandrium_andersonii.AAC.1